VDFTVFARCSGLIGFEERLEPLGEGDRSSISMIVRFLALSTVVWRAVSDIGAIRFAWQRKEKWSQDG
jgi:hypothetical protein